MLELQAEKFPYLDSAQLFERVADQDWAIFLDSGAHQGARPVSRHANYDVLACQPITTLITEAEQTCIANGPEIDYSDADPFLLLQQALPDIKGQSPYRFGPGALGYFSYDLARRFEELPVLAGDPEQLPQMAIGIYSAVVVIDHLHKHTQLVYLHGEHNNVMADAQLLGKWRALIEEQITKQQSVTKAEPRLHSSVLQENMTRDDYRKKFARVRDYTIEGDCYQVNLAKQFSTAVTGNAWKTYQRLREMSPAPYGAYCNYPFAQILSNSPESFIQCRAGEVVTSPIKGTAPRDHDNPENDAQAAVSLQNSKKDQAENLMIVDLMRNDLSKSCELGSVKVPQLFKLHSFANVHHLISTITGSLREGLHALDLLRSCFPGGSITGAPKIRAMEIIEELEPTRRGVYCGAIAYVGVDGSLETNIAIRTIAVKDGVARFAAGGGLVIDSNVEQEYQELLDKASMMHAALKN
ncbi:MAG: aminodeoxychorismate synthase component I [Gammaproteobacteria bacterium]|nr:aminodeoxychorismate synthase component I [Gammaproteobacteria bacterium]